MREFSFGEMFSPLSSGLCSCVPFFLNAWEGKGLAGGRVVSESDIVTFPPQTPGFRGVGWSPGCTCVQATPVSSAFLTC